MDMQSKNDLYPKLTGEVLIFDKENLKLVLLCPVDNSGFKVEGLGAHFCTLLDGKRKLKDVIEAFRANEGAKVLALEKEVERLIGRLTSNHLLEFHESVT